MAGLYQPMQQSSCDGIFMKHMFLPSRAQQVGNSNSDRRAMSGCGGSPTKYENAKQMWGWLLGPPLTESQNAPAGLYQFTQDRF